MKVNTSASGKVFFSGEYMALEGGRSIVLSTKQRAYVSIKKDTRKSNMLVTSMSNNAFPFLLDNKLDLIWEDRDPEDLGSILKFAVKEFGQHFDGLSISIDTKDFFYRERKIGIGSSSAISVALTRALVQFFDSNMDSKRIMDISMDIHNKSQLIIGSGFDIVSACEDETILSCKKQKSNKLEYKAIQLPEDLLVTGVINQISSSTSDMIKKYHKVKELNQEYFKMLIPKLNKDLDGIYESMIDKDMNMTISFLRSYRSLMLEMDREFGIDIYTIEHQELMKLADDFGIFYKPSGAGGGDLGILVSNDRAKLDEFSEFLSSTNIKFFPII